MRDERANKRGPRENLIVTLPTCWQDKLCLATTSTLAIDFTEKLISAFTEKKKINNDNTRNKANSYLVFTTKTHSRKEWNIKMQTQKNKPPRAIPRRSWL